MITSTLTTHATFIAVLVAFYICYGQGTITHSHGHSPSQSHRHHRTKTQHVPWAEHRVVEPLSAQNWGYKLDAWYRDTVRNVTAQPDFHKHRSQGIQDLILNKIFEFVPPKHKFFVEFGFDSSSYEGSMGANTATLHKQGWNGLLLDINYQNPAINLHKEKVGPDNIVLLLEKYKVPYDADYISIDIDSVDAFVFHAILSSSYHPAVISSEYNCLLPLYSNLCNSGWDRNSKVPYMFNGDRLFGTSILPLKTVADMFGYSIVAIDVGLDVFFVRNDLLADTAVLPYAHWGFYATNYTHDASDGWTSIDKPRLPNYNMCWTEGAGKRGWNHTDLIDSYLIRFDEWLVNGHDIAAAAGKKVFEEVNSFHIILNRHVP